MESLVQAIGRAVQEGRTRKSLTPLTLAERSYVSLEDITAAEDGRLLLSTGKLERIAGVLDLEPFPLFKGQFVVTPEAALFFRHGSHPDFVDEDLGQLRRALEGGLALLEVNEILQRPLGLRSLFKPEEPAGDKVYRVGYVAAQRVREALGNEQGPLLDLRAIIEDRFDVAIVAARLRTRGAFAVTVKEPSRGAAAIVLNTAKGEASGSPLARRVSLAHELAHVLFDEEALRIDLVTADSLSGDPIERRANAFAAELLIPLAGLEAQWGKAQMVSSPAQADALIDQVRAEYLTPPELTVNHLINREYIVKDEAFRKNLIKAAVVRKSPVDVPELTLAAPREDAPSIALTERLREAHERILITGGRAREALGLPPGAPLPWEVAL
ncbi:MAG: ImmA/IrrE family metallo-endopeptidase [Polyangiaceae bacterium]|jgi:Zn-dependent peptidase ImmA (M78 family)|nr:ImmA/IrrE family metallo-endopeptidase [Polyangiaceae bacterium]